MTVTWRVQQDQAQGAPVSTDGIEPLGSVRRSQLVSTFGVGAIVDLEKGSFMPMGLEDWERVTRLPALRIGEPRLQAMLGVSHFRVGPVKEEIPGTTQVRARSAAPAVRFPQWHECPKCHRIGKEGAPFELATDRGRLICLAHGGATVHTTPVRFVVACRRGHINDFPLGMVGSPRAGRWHLRLPEPLPGFVRSIRIAGRSLCRMQGM